MQEEYHGIKHEDTTYTFKLLYGWGTINANIWLPSLSELVGTDPDHYHDPYGCYFSAMQGLNTTTWYCVDTKGGAQWKLFEAYNASGGGEAITKACNQEWSWLRSPDYGQNHSLMTYYSANKIQSNRPATASHAVHPAMDADSTSHFGYTLSY